MNRLFTAWVENIYHRRVHSETKQEPLRRWVAGAPFPVPRPADLAGAFRWSEHRRVAKQGSPLSCLLVGQPTLRRTMKLAVLAGLEQRTALRYTMPGMTCTETAGYVARHLKIAGRLDQLFTEGALTLIHTTSRGYPRAVNNLSLQALVAAFATGKNLVDEAAARAAVSEVVGH
ncbi:hypothetical protein GCM10022206_13070 [Streptomyces chiangmaiensis]